MRTTTRPLPLSNGRTIPAGTTLRPATSDESARIDPAAWLFAGANARAYVFEGAVFLVATR
jgi:hypothetical protein